MTGATIATAILDAARGYADYVVIVSQSNERGGGKVNYLYYDVNVGADGVVEVTLDKQANVRLLDDSNYSRYRRGEKHQYYGGRAVKSPVRLKVPHSGHWNLVVDLGGNSGTVRASVRTIGGAS